MVKVIKLKDYQHIDLIDQRNNETITRGVIIRIEEDDNTYHIMLDTGYRIRIKKID